MKLYSGVHRDFQKLSDEWVESRFGYGDESRDELAAFVASLTEEQLYEAVQAAMEHLDKLYDS